MHLLLFAFFLALVVGARHRWNANIVRSQRITRRISATAEAVPVVSTARRLESNLRNPPLAQHVPEIPLVIAYEVSVPTEMSCYLCDKSDESAKVCNGKLLCLDCGNDVKVAKDADFSRVEDVMGILDVERLAGGIRERDTSISRERARSLVREFARFMILKRSSIDSDVQTIYPSPAVDMVWQKIILDTQAYAIFQFKMFEGKRLHHGPPSENAPVVLEHRKRLGNWFESCLGVDETAKPSSIFID